MNVRGFGISARQWQQSIAEELVSWRLDTGCRISNMKSVCDSVSATVSMLAGRVDSAHLARKLPEALSRCDDLDFSELEAGLAYLILHFADRYGRADQVLERLLRQGFAPIRKARVMILDVGAGPAPSSYAALDFYNDLARWTADSDNKYEIGTAIAHPMDRGPAWDQVVHHFSEQLAAVRKVSPDSNLAIPFQRTYKDFKNFSVREQHNRFRKEVMEEIVRDYDRADEYIDPRTAWQQAYEIVPDIPSAYDLVFISNFLTSVTITGTFRQELIRLGSSLTPGGVLLFLTATGKQYPMIHGKIEEIASHAKLSPIAGFDQPIEANPNGRLRGLLANQVRTSVEQVRTMSKLSPSDWRAIVNGLPKDLVDVAVPFSLPKFRAFAYRRTKSAPSALMAGRRRK